jgi:predicted alpha/beta hydrolase family esterase
MGRSDIAQTPPILTVPGLMNSGPGHWQSLWEASQAGCKRVELGSWERPHRNSWVNRLDQAINAVDGPVVLAAHSLGCHAVAWWAALSSPNWSDKIRGALLVAPPEVDARAVDSRLHGFAPLPKRLLPFPSILVASHNDPYMPFERSRTLAQIWGSQFADAGETGHINAQSGLGDWTFGRFLLTRLAKEQVAARSSIIDRPVSDFDAVDPRIEGIGRRPALKNEGGKYD